jgi:chemotaxis response regulator CheB
VANGELIRVLVVDDHRMVREGLRSYLELIDDIAMVGDASDGRSALDWLARAKAHGALPDVLLMDLLMEPMGGIEATAAILYRIVLEALNNAVKHARATQAAVHVARAGGRLVITVSDDGVGFDVGQSHPAISAWPRCGNVRRRSAPSCRFGGAGDRGTIVTVALAALAVAGSDRVR